jgi:hypothetical protein
VSTRHEQHDGQPVIAVGLAITVLSGIESCRICAFHAHIHQMAALSIGVSSDERLAIYSLVIYSFSDTQFMEQRKQHLLVVYSFVTQKN